MDTLESVEKRRAVKHYDPQHKMSDEEKNRLLSLALLSPTSFNIQNWRFVVIEDEDTRKNIREAAWDQAQVTDASMLIVICANVKSWKADPERYWAQAPEDIRKMMVPMIGQFYEGNEQLQRDEAMRSTGIAAQTLMLCAKSMGYDSCPMVGFDFEKVAQIIKLPEDHIISMFVVVGKALKEANPRGGQLPLDEVVLSNSF